jgi:hypothetical protein
MTKMERKAINVLIYIQKLIRLMRSDDPLDASYQIENPTPG